MNILSIDPGTTESAWMTYISEDGKPLTWGFSKNEVLLAAIRDHEDGDMTTFGCRAEHLAIEGIASYGMAVGREVFETCMWIGRMIERWDRDYTLVYRREVKMHLCGSAKAKDGNVRAALLDRFGPGKAIACGTKKTPGPLYGIAKHHWSTLGIACFWADTHKEEFASRSTSTQSESPTSALTRMLEAAGATVVDVTPIQQIDNAKRNAKKGRAR